MNNKGRSYRFRGDVVSYLHAAGFTEARARTETRILSAELRAARDTGDIVGLSPWTLAVRSGQSIDLSGAMNEVRGEAERAGSSLFASIQLRRGHPAAESFVTMPLHVFTRILAQTEVL